MPLNELKDRILNTDDPEVLQHIAVRLLEDVEIKNRNIDAYCLQFKRLADKMAYDNISHERCRWSEDLLQ